MAIDISPRPNDYILHECIKGNLEALEQYIQEGKSILHRNCFNDSLISMAAKAKQYDVIDYLLNKGYPKYDIDGDGHHFIHYLLRSDEYFNQFISLIEKHQIDLIQVDDINRGGLINEAISNKSFAFFQYFCEHTSLDIYKDNKHVKKTLDAFQTALIHNEEIALYIYEHYDFELNDKADFTSDIKISADFIPEYHEEFRKKLEAIKPLKDIRKEQQKINATISSAIQKNKKIKI